MSDLADIPAPAPIELERPQTDDPTTHDPSTSETPSKKRPGLSRSHSLTASLKDSWDRQFGGEPGEREEWMSAFTLLDVLETFFDSRLDLFERKLKVHSDRIKTRAGEVISSSAANVRAFAPKSPKLSPWDPLFSPSIEAVDEATGELRLGGASSSRSKWTDNERRVAAEKELKRFRAKVSARLQNLSNSWESQKTLRTRDKVAFVFSVMTVLSTALMFGMAPEWIPVWYTVQSAFYLPTRTWSYKRKDWHYFLFDMCYYVNLLDLAWIWLFPSNTVLFIACYLLSMGPLASAIVTWRNSLVFHSLDKVTSLFIHIYPPFTLTVILHIYPGREERFPGIVKMHDMGWWRSILLGIGFYVVWQALYWRFVIIGRREKIKAGLRPTSFEHLLHDKHNIIGRWLRATAPQKRESMFMFWQLVYTIVCFLPAVFLLGYSRFWSNAFILFVFFIATTNGAGYYVDVYGLRGLRKELAAIAPSDTSSPREGDRPLASQPGTTPPSPLSRPAHSALDGPVGGVISAMVGETSPLVLGLSHSKSDADLEGFSLDGDQPSKEAEVKEADIRQRKVVPEQGQDI